MKKSFIKEFPNLKSFLKSTSKKPDQSDKKSENNINDENFSIKKNSYFTQLFYKNYIDKPYFNFFDIPVLSKNVSDFRYHKSFLKKAIPFQIIYNSLIIPWLATSEQFFSENSFTLVSKKKKSYEKENKKIKRDKKKKNLEIKILGSVNPIKTLNYIKLKKTPIEYNDRLISNQDIIFITEQIYSKLGNENFLCNFTVHKASNQTIIKFTDLKLIKINFKDSIELYAYELCKNTSPSYYQSCDLGKFKIIMKCSSFFTQNNNIKRIYPCFENVANIRFLPGNELIVSDYSGKKINNLSFLKKINLNAGNYVIRGKKIYKIGKEGEVFATEGFCLENEKDFF